MSKSRQTAESGVLIRFWTLDHHRGERVDGPPVSWPTLVFAESGALFVDHADHRWTLPANRALPIPEGSRYMMRTLASARVRSLYFGPEWPVPLEPIPVEVSPLLRELILAACARGPLLSREPEHKALATVIRAELLSAPQSPTGLPWPTADWLRSLATCAAETATHLEVLVAATGYSRRTVERAMQAETRLSLGRWMRQARMARALVGLSDGATVSEAAIAAGYSEPSAFIHAFRREFGTTPGAWSK